MDAAIARASPRATAYCQPADTIAAMRKNTLFSLGLAIASTAALAQTPVTKFPSNLADSLKQGYLNSYVSANKQKAFALTPDHQKASAVFGFPTVDEAARAASVRCLAEHRVPCRIWLANDQNMLDAYASASRASKAAMAKLPVGLDGKAFAEETTDMNVEPPKVLHLGTEIHGPTPMKAPSGSKTIATDALVKLYKTQPNLVVLDVLHSKALIRQTLPKTAWLYGAGWEGADINKDIAANFTTAMRTLAPRKDTPIVTYCSNRECWLSWNAALRLVKAGYTRVYWYRGGIEAWRQAELPTVETPLTASLW